MKKIRLNMQLLLLSVVLLSVTGCTQDFENMNRNPNQVTEDQMNAMNYLIGTRIYALQSLVIPVEEHMYQFNESLTGGPFAGYVGTTQDTWRTKFDTFNPSMDWRKWPFANVITETYRPYRGVLDYTDDEFALALAKVLRVAIMQRVTDSYGPIPYSELEKNQSITVKYDSQETVYAKMFEQLDEALVLLHRNISSSTAAWNRYDAVYFGNIAQWIKYTNSLKLRLAMRLSEVKPDLARAKAAEAIAGGVIASNADNAAMHAVENRTTLIYNGWQDSRVGADIVNYLNGYQDPRREKMLLPNNAGIYAGLRIGIDVARKDVAVDKCSNMVIESTMPYLWLNAAEAAFLQSEYELRWGTPAAAQTFYERGIKLSFEERGASGADTYIANNTSKPAAYTDPLGLYSVSVPQSTITIAWESDSSAEVKERNLERLITQKWIAIFPLGTEGWSEYRRTGYPRLLPAIEDKSGGTVDLEYGARRMPYPVEEYQKNNVNLQAAIQMLDQATQGTRKGDTMGTRVWWDCKPYNK